MNGVISLPEATSYDKNINKMADRCEGFSLTVLSNFGGH